MRSSVRIVFVVVLALLSFDAGAQSHPPSYYDNATWVGTSSGVAKVLTSSGAETDYALSSTPKRVAIDDRNGVVWIFRPRAKLRALNFDGTVAVADLNVPLPDLSIPAADVDPLVPPDTTILLQTLTPKYAGLAVDLATGDVWVAIGTGYFRYSQTGSLISSSTPSIVGVPSPDYAVGMAISGSRHWEAFRNSVRDLTSGLTITPPSNQSVVAIDADRDSGNLFVVYSGSIVRYSSSGALLFSLSINNGVSVTADPAGGAYVATTTDLIHLDSTNALVFDLAPYSGAMPPTPIVALTVDLSNEHAWVASPFILEDVTTAPAINRQVIFAPKTMKSHGVGTSASLLMCAQ